MQQFTAALCRYLFNGTNAYFIICDKENEWEE